MCSWTDFPPYRKDRPLQKPVKIAGQPIAALLENLKHPTDGVRHRTRVELSGRDSDAVIAAAQKWSRDFDPDNEVEAHHLLEALWLHQQHGVINEELLNTLISSKVPHAANAAKTVKHLWYNVESGASGFAAPAEIELVKFDTPKHLKGKDRDGTSSDRPSINGNPTVRRVTFPTARAMQTFIHRCSTARGSTAMRNV